MYLSSVTSLGIEFAYSFLSPSGIIQTNLKFTAQHLKEQINVWKTNHYEA